VKNRKILVGDETYLVGDKTYLVGDKTYLVGDKTYLVGDKTYLVGDKTYLVGDKTYLVGDIFEKTSNQNKVRHINFLNFNKIKKNCTTYGFYGRRDCRPCSKPFPVGDWQYYLNRRRPYYRRKGVASKPPTL
jgi:hypothetical protein